MGSVIRFLRTARLLLGDDEQSVLAYFRNTTLPGGGDTFDKIAAQLLVARCYMLCNSH